MKKIFLVIIVAASSVLSQQVSKLAQEKVPPEVQRIIDETMSGQHGLINFEEHKVGLGFDSSTKLSDLKAGEPIKVYKIFRDSLEKMDENVPISAIAKFVDTWRVPVLIKGKCVTTFEVWKTRQNSHWHEGIFNGCYKGRYDEWQKVKEAWPKSAGYNPVIVYFGGWKTFFHVPEKDDTNLTPLMRRSYDSLAMTVDTSYRILMSSKHTLRYLKGHLPARRNRGVK